MNPSRRQTPAALLRLRFILLPSSLILSAMLLPLHTDRRLSRTPAANVGIIAVTVAMFLVQTASPAVEAALLLRPFELSPQGILGSAFLHAGWMHLLGNMLFLYIFGNNINDALGHAAYVGFYLGGAVAAGLLHAAVSSTPALGASGAVWAVSGAYLAMYPRSRIVLLIFYFVITTVSIPAIWFIGLRLALDVFFGLNDSVFGSNNGVANWAHVGGGVYGIVLSTALMKLGLVSRDRFDLLALAQRRKQRRLDVAERRRLGQTHESAMDIVPASQANPLLAKTQDLRAQIAEATERGDATRAADLYLELIQVDPRQTLARNAQLEMANQLYRENRHADAAAAYERYLERFAARPDAESAGARLILGLLYGRYLGDASAAQSTLARAADELESLGMEADAAFAREELAGLASA